MCVLLNCWKRISNQMASPEVRACSATPVKQSNFNLQCKLPHGLTTAHVRRAMTDFVEFLGFINTQLNSRDMPRMETFLMPANFSSMVGEFMNMSIPKYCGTLVKNKYHNGHPDLIPAGRFPNDEVQYSNVGLEVKGSRHLSGWQGHNPEAVWLMVFCFESNTSNDQKKNIPPKSFKFTAVYAAKLKEEDWAFSGRSKTSRRTITASVTQPGVKKMKANWVYEDLS